MKILDGHARTLGGHILSSHGAVAAKLGPELYINNDANWTTDLGVTVSNGVLTFTGAEGNSLQNNYEGGFAVLGKTYRVEAEILSLTSGRFDLRIAAAGDADMTTPDLISVGIFTKDITVTAVTGVFTGFQVFGRSTAVGTIRVNSIKEVL